jgi:molecular chaperone GrpE (heat shock protein)
MEAILREPLQEGEQEKTCTEIVAQVLSKSSTFLRNVGLQQPVATPKSVSPQMQELQAQLEAEKEESAGLWLKVQRLEAQAEESEAKAQRQAEEIENLKKATADTQKAAAETQNLIRQMIAFGQSQATHQTTPL